MPIERHRPPRKESSLALVAEPRLAQKPKWVSEQKKRLGRKCDSYWYTTEKGEWTKNASWPVQLQDWQKIQGWVVRKQMKPGEALKPGFSKDVLRLFKELYPLLQFTSLSE